jgi:hypothetical protein
MAAETRDSETTDKTSAAVSDDDVKQYDEIAHHEWNNEERGETELQRLDRNFNEILQELRVAQTGVQILFAFLLTLAFSQRFTAISAFQRDLYILTLMLTAAATGLLIAPVGYHRITFRQRMRPQLVSAANWLALGGLAFLMLAMTSSILFITDVVLDRAPAVAITAGSALWFLVFWFGIPMIHLWQRVERDYGRLHAPDEPGGDR